MVPWAKAASINGSYGNIDGATGTIMSSYTPTTGDVGNIGCGLQATVTYDGRRRVPKTRRPMMKSMYSVQECPQRSADEHTTREFPTDQDPVRSDTKADASREVAENTPARARIMGAPVARPLTPTATYLTYSLETARMAARITFDIDQGDRSVDDQGGSLDHTQENDNGTYYTVTVTGNRSLLGCPKYYDPEVTINGDTVTCNHHRSPMVTGAASIDHAEKRRAPCCDVA